MPLERQHARYIVSVHEADGLPRASGGNFVASVKKVLVQDNQQQLINTYVQVSFAGLTVSMRNRLNLTDHLFFLCVYIHMTSIVKQLIKILFVT